MHESGARLVHGAGPAPQGCSMQWPKPPGRSLMNVRGDAASRGMTAHDRIRLTGPFAELIGFTNDSPGRESSQPGLTIMDPNGICQKRWRLDTRCSESEAHCIDSDGEDADPSTQLGAGTRQTLLRMTRFYETNFQTRDTNRVCLAGSHRRLLHEGLLQPSVGAESNRQARASPDCSNFWRVRRSDSRLSGVGRR
jgi:hypothetical protein